MTPNNNTAELRIGHIVNQATYRTAAVDVALAINNYTSLRSDIIAWQDVDPQLIEDDLAVRNVSTATSRSRPTEKIKTLSSILSDYDVVNTYHTLSGLISSAICQQKGIPTAIRVGNAPSQLPFYHRGIRLLTSLLSTAIVCVSNSVATMLRGPESILPEQRIRVIPNGVDLTTIEQAATTEWSIYDLGSINTESTVIGHTGALVEQKNQDLLILAIDQLINEHGRNVELVIAGDGPRYDELRKLVANRNLESNIHFLGYIDRQQVYKMNHEIDCYAMPSAWEGFSMAVLQAMATGTPCALSDIPSFRSQYPESTAAFFSTDSPSTVASGILCALNQDYLGEQAKAHVNENYDLETMAKRYSDMYQDISQS